MYFPIFQVSFNFQFFICFNLIAIDTTCFPSGNSQLSCKYLINLTMADVQKTMTFVLTNRNFTICTPPQSKMFTESAIYVNMEHLDAVREVNSPFHIALILLSNLRK